MTDNLIGEVTEEMVERGVRAYKWTREFGNDDYIPAAVKRIYSVMKALDPSLRAGSNEVERDQLTAALVALAQAGVEPDIQELLVAGNPLRGIAPGALAAALRTVQQPRETVIDR